VLLGCGYMMHVLRQVLRPGALPIVQVRGARPHPPLQRTGPPRHHALFLMQCHGCTSVNRALPTGPNLYFGQNCRWRTKLCRPKEALTGLKQVHTSAPGAAPGCPAHRPGAGRSTTPAPAARRPPARRLRDGGTPAASCTRPLSRMHAHTPSARTPARSVTGCMYFLSCPLPHAVHTTVTVAQPDPRGI
jgi:hypothetical protein